ncbi:1-phosphatidylinositol 4,5-bisphosphate phosphodiesterase beta-3 [Clarias gariepinus]|uniref:1-phosphatidylinositol 4,5-bisphosphate phosphodiesterase beta-3 n=1 Tax=Clarias gariepinus TaxID=13013 RepID=UPI00234C1D55|nr:1-phosphatidylinositol 4,5-bisphosphate phosphodiesterase beta-3 [Clarias gariepinus]
MAGAKPGVHTLQLKPVCVPELLKAGSKFIKWDEEPNNGAMTQVTMKVDPEGFFLFWISPNGETDIVDISHIRDTRYGKFAKIPKDSKICDRLGLVKGEIRENLMPVTIVYGNDLVNITFLNFLAIEEGTAKVWTEELLKLATNLLSLNASRSTFLRKAWTKLTLHVNQDGRIPLKHIIKMFSDKKRVETALEQCDLIVNKAEGIKLKDFTWEKFQSFLNKLCLRSEIDRIFVELGSKGKPFLSLDQMTDFLNRKQRDPRLNEVLYPPLKREQVRQLMEKYDTNTRQLERDQISLMSFSKYLESDENAVVPSERFDVMDDMTQPLSHYFINSSHNTYLTMGQLTGLSSVEMYRQVLLTGCRCIELDCWKGRPPEEDPIITHGFTMTTEIPFKEVIEAIAESAFKASPYPLILSFENHVDSAIQQEKMAECCRNIFGDALLIDPLEKYPLIPGQPLPSPQDLMGKILIKNKKRHYYHIRDRFTANGGSISRKEGADEQASSLNDASLPEGETSQIMSNGGEKLAEKMSKDTRKSIDRGDGDSEEEEEEEPVTDPKKHHSDEGTAYSEATATEEMSTLVNYIEPVKFKSFRWASERRKYYEMSSFVETRGMDALKSFPIDFVEYNKNQLSRIYPKGTRVDSSNYMPQLFWNVGCQMVALNFQTLDLPMQLNMGVFEYNGRSGYLLKPEFMIRTDKHFDPFTEEIVDGIVANTVKIKIVSGQFLTDKKVGVYVEADMFGLPTDTKRKYRTKTSNNSMDPVWEEEPFVFLKVVLPTLASLRVAVFEENGKFIGHRILPVVALRPGYHYINLKNELNQPLLFASLFVYTEVQDYIPNEHQEYAEALTNPIKHVLDQRERQLAVLMEDNDDISKQVLVKSEQGEKPDFSLVSNEFPFALPSPTLPPLVADVLTAPAPKEDLVITVLTAISPQSIDELRQEKSYVKLYKKQCKELKELHKKHLKKLWSLGKEQKTRSNQLNSDIQRRKSQVEKKLRLSIKKNEPAEPVRTELSNLEMELEKRTVQLREWQMQELLELRKKQHKLEREKKFVHFEESFKKLKVVAEECQTTQIKKLKDICDREKREMQMILERKRLNSIFEARKGDREKAEAEMNEINRKHIQESVNSLRKLDEAQVKRQELLKTQQKEILLKIDEDQPLQRLHLERECDAELERLPEEIRRYLQGELEGKGLRNDALYSHLPNSDSSGSGPPSNCSTPPFNSPNHSTASLGDSSSSSTITTESESTVI